MLCIIAFFYILPESLILFLYWLSKLCFETNCSYLPVKAPPRVVSTPLALLTAVLVKEPVVGMDMKNDPSRLHVPSANISWVASTVRPFAIKYFKFLLYLDSQSYLITFLH